MKSESRLKNEGVRIVRLGRSLGPTCSFWNNFYANERRMIPGKSYPPVKVVLQLRTVRLCQDWCVDQYRKYIDANFLGTLIYVLKIANNTKKQGKLLIVHVHAPIIGFLVLIIKIINSEIKIVTTQHNDWRFFRLHQKLGLIILSRLSDYYIACGKSVIETIPPNITKYLNNKAKLSYISNGINPQLLQPYDNLRNIHNNSNIQCVVIARMVPQKNCQFILNLLTKIPKIDKLIWFGDGPERQILEKEIVKLGIENRIELKGQRPRNEVFSELAKGTFYLTASLWEGLSVADIEATGLGCWPIMSDIIQRKEIAEVLNVSLYPLSDMDKWVEAIDSFLNLPLETQQNMRLSIMKKTRAHFSLETMIRSYFSLYSSLGNIN